MGWGSGVDLFDDAVRVAFKYASESAYQEIVKELYTSQSFRYSDWDTQQESDYFDPYLKRVMIDLGELEVCPTCHDIDYDFYNNEGHCYNEKCPDSKYYEGD